MAWFIQPLKHKDGYWTLCASSDEGGGFYKGCEHKHTSAEEAQDCQDAIAKCNSMSGFGYRDAKQADAPFPGMREAFEAHYGQSFVDRDWRVEAACWAAAWKAAISKATGVRS